MSRFPWTAVPAQRSSAAALKVRFRLIMGLLAVGVISGPIGCMAALGGAGSDSPAVEAPVAKGLTEIAAREWLAGKVPSVPMADGIKDNLSLSGPEGQPHGAPPSPVVANATLAWAGFSKHSLLENVPDKAQVYEVHRFSVAGGRLYELAVTALLTPQGPVLAAVPSLAPITAVTTEFTPVDYSQVDQAQVNEAVRAQVEDWAKAYADGGDPRAIAKAAGDDDPAHTYQGLGGFTAEKISIHSAYLYQSTGNLLIRARVLLRSAEGSAANSDFDLLLGDHTSQFPKVLAWGPPGSGPSLTKHQNALVTKSATKETP